MTPAANYVSGFLCDNGAVTGVNAAGTAGTVTADAGDIGQLITCTFSNARKGQVIIQKQTVNGNGTFTFSSPTIDFIPAVADTITTVGGNGTTSLSATVAAGQYVVTEADNSGFALTNLVCSDAGQPAGQASTVDIGNRVATINVAAGESVTCIYTNTRKSATFTLVKDWQDATAGNVVNLDADGTDVANGHIIDTTSTASNDTTAAMTVFSGETVSFAEAFQVPAQGDNYVTTTSCVQTGTATPVGANYAADQRSGTYVVPATPINVTCTIRMI